MSHERSITSYKEKMYKLGEKIEDAAEELAIHLDACKGPMQFQIILMDLMFELGKLAQQIEADGWTFMVGDGDRAHQMTLYALYYADALKADRQGTAYRHALSFVSLAIEPYTA